MGISLQTVIGFFMVENILSCIRVFEGKGRENINKGGIFSVLAAK